MNAVLYLRVSTTKQEAANQEHQLRALCEARGWTIDRVYEDVVTGGERLQADALAWNDLQHDLRTGRVRLVVFWAWDRLTREGGEAAFAIMGQWKQWGARWESLQEPYLSSGADGATAELLLPIIAWIAKQERKRLSERTKAGMARIKQLTGKHMGRPMGAKDKRPRKRAVRT